MTPFIFPSHKDVFVAEGLTASKEKPEDFEAIRATKAVSFSEIASMIKNGALVDGQSLAALIQFAVWRKVV